MTDESTKIEVDQADQADDQAAAVDVAALVEERDRLAAELNDERARRRLAGKASAAVTGIELRTRRPVNIGGEPVDAGVTVGVLVRRGRVPFAWLRAAIANDWITDAAE
jgi:hypothetical protein